MLIECKASKGLHELISDIRPTRAVLFAPVNEAYPFTHHIQVSTLADMVSHL